MAVTQCQLSWALLATIGCSAVSRDDDVGEDHDDDDDDDVDYGDDDDDGDDVHDGVDEDEDNNEDAHAKTLLPGVAGPLLSWNRRVSGEIALWICLSSLHVIALRLC